MSKLKDVESYLSKVNSLTLRKDLYEIGKQMQKDAWNAALDGAIENASVTYIDLTNGEEFDYTDVISDDDVSAIVSDESILKLKIK